VHRRLDGFEGRGPLRAWLYSIVVRVASQYRRTRLRKDLEHTEDPDGVADTTTLGPEDNAGQNEDVRLLLELLDELEEGKREVFVLADLEGLTAPEVADLLELKLNTVYSRLRTARLELKAALERRRGPERRWP
ncbi:MAG TPA: sigma-70 family RNA polymerase sigma factor, partial [Polyangiaceae bacterium]|nr:sigma-70 family RNA polymerase sigma factor [Polyangiaceae bacterium]